MTIIRKETWVYNNKEYPSEQAAKEAELEHLGKAKVAYNKYMENTYGGKRLLQRYNLDKISVWQIRGEGEPDMGAGPGPMLGTFRGKLRDVIQHAVAIPRFWNWGGGGEITEVEIIDIPKEEFNV